MRFEKPFLSRLVLILTGITAASLNSIAATAQESGPTGRFALPDGFQSGMHAVLLGVGARFSIQDEGGSSVLVLVDGEPLLFDVGPMAVQRLAKAGVNPGLVRQLFITHLHMDHISGFPEFLSLNHTFGGRVHVVGPPAVTGMVEGAKAFLDVDLRAIERLLGRKTDVTVTEVDRSRVVLETDKYTVTAAQTPHMDLEGPHSFAYRVESKYGSVVVSGDTAPSLNVLELAESADLLIHEVFIDPTTSIDQAVLEALDPETREALRKGPDTLEDGLRAQPPRFGHSVAAEVGKLASAADVQTLVLYHRPVFASTQSEYALATRVWGLSESAVSYDNRSNLIAAVKEHFDGPVIMGEPLMVFRPGSADE